MKGKGSSSIRRLDAVEYWGSMRSVKSSWGIEETGCYSTGGAGSGGECRLSLL